MALRIIGTLYGTAILISDSFFFILAIVHRASEFYCSSDLWFNTLFLAIFVIKNATITLSLPLQIISLPLPCTVQNYSCCFFQLQSLLSNFATRKAWFAYYMSTQLICIDHLWLLEGIKWTESPTHAGMHIYQIPIYQKGIVYISTYARFVKSDFFVHAVFVYICVLSQFDKVW